MPITTAIENNTTQPSWDSIAGKNPIAKALWQQWDRLSVSNGVLRRKSEYTDGRQPVQQTVIPYQLRKDFVSEIHRGITGGHIKINTNILFVGLELPSSF